jgi:hypothetical protein
VLLQCGGQVAGFFQRLQAGHALGPVALVAGNALAHLAVPRLGGGDEQGVVRGRLGQPVTRQQLGTAGLAAFLAAEDQLRAADLHGVAHAATPPSSRATATGLDGNQAWK